MGTAILIAVFTTLLGICISVYLLFRWLRREAVSLLRLKHPMTAEELRHIRYRLGFSQSELAEELGVSLRAVQSWEQGWRKIPANAALLVRVFRYMPSPTGLKGHGHSTKGRFRFGF